MKMLVFAAAAAALIAVPAAAQPPPKGWVGPLSTPSILCDTRAQVESIVDAFEQGTEAGTARFAELFQTMNNRQEPTCAIAALRTVVAVDSTDLGQLSIAGAELFGWIVHIQNGAGEGFYLYLESPAEALKNTI
jgi:hypothetical protein